MDTDRNTAAAATANPPAAAEPAPTLDQWVEIFVNEHSRAKHLRPSSIAEQRRMFRLYLLPVLGASTRIDAAVSGSMAHPRMFIVPGDFETAWSTFSHGEPV